jgi:hypothetical protein
VSAGSGCGGSSAPPSFRWATRWLTFAAAPTEVAPGDVYDLAWLVLGELAYLHAMTPGAPPVSPLEPFATGFRLPGHVDQLARTLAAQLATIG